MIGHVKGIAVNYGDAYRLWAWNQGGRWTLKSKVDSAQMVAVDINNDSKENQNAL